MKPKPWRPADHTKDIKKAAAKARAAIRAARYPLVPLVLEKGDHHIRVRWPLKLGLGENDRMHHMAKARRTKKTHADVRAWAIATLRRSEGWAFPLTITITRVSPGRIDGHDNMRTAAKSLVDAIAIFFVGPDADDGDESKFRWEYDRKKGGVGEYAVEVEVREA